MGSKKEKPKQKIHRDWHHVFPTSRFKMKKLIKYHRAWHWLFSDLVYEEAISKIRNQWTDSEGKVDFSKMTEREKEKWLVIFSPSVTTLAEAIRLIYLYWSIPGMKIIFNSDYIKKESKYIIF